jgi:prepilin-type N-terminal cleavage/methylation domain-containing protein
MRKPAGFTLLEVVLAMTALALLMVLAYSAFFLGMRAVEKGTNAVVAQQRLRASRDVIIRQLKSLSFQTVFPTENGELDVDGEQFCLLGTPTAVTFFTEAAQGGGGGLARVLYRVLDDPPRLELIEDRSERALTTCSFELSDEATEPVVLADGFLKLRFQYMHNETYRWVDEWNSLGEEPGNLPLAVQVVIEGVMGADLDVATQALPIPIMLFAQDDALASEPETACETNPACQDAQQAAEIEESEGPGDKDDEKDEDVDDNDPDEGGED